MSDTQLSLVGRYKSYCLVAAVVGAACVVLGVYPLAPLPRPLAHWLDFGAAYLSLCVSLLGIGLLGGALARGRRGGLVVLISALALAFLANATGAV